MRIKIIKTRKVTLKGIYKRNLHSKGSKPPKLEKPYDTIKNTNIDKLFSLMDIAICNMQEKRKAVNIKYNVLRGTIQREVYNQFFVKSCNRANCLKCKRLKSFNYLKDRIFSKLQSSYFLTIATDISSSDTELDKKYKDFRILVKNFFDYHQLNNYTSYEIEGENQMLHCHTLVLNPTMKSKTLTTLFKIYSGYYTHGKIVNINKKNIDTYISKIVGYSSKFKKDTLDKFNTLEISENVYNFLKTDIKDMEFREFRGEKNIEINEIKSIFDLLSNVFNSSDSIGALDYKKVGLFLSGAIFQKRYNFLNFVRNNIYTKNIENQTLKQQNFLKKYGFLQFDKIDFVKLNQKEISEKQNEFIRRWWLGNKTVFEVYKKAILFLQDNANLFQMEIENEKRYYIQGYFLFNNLLKKRISSNLSIFETRNNYSEKIENETFTTEIDIEMEFKDFSENTYPLDVDVKTKKEIKNQKEIDILSKFRVYKISEVYNSRIVKNFIENQNQHIKKDSDLILELDLNFIKALCLENAKNKAKLKYKKAKTKFEINQRNDYQNDYFLDTLDKLKKWYGITID